MTKMAIDQLLFTPVATAMFYSIIKTMEGEAEHALRTLPGPAVTLLPERCHNERAGNTGCGRAASCHLPGL